MAIEALEHVQKAGMDPYLNITVGHYNANTEHFKQLLDYSKKKRYKTLLNVAVPQLVCGKRWMTSFVMIMTENI